MDKTKATEKGKSNYSLNGLHLSQNAKDLIDSHNAVQEFWSPYNDKREELHDMRKGKQWTDKELEIMRRKGKAPVVFNKIISAVRFIMGTFIQNKYDMQPAPFEPNDQKLADIIKQRYHWHIHNGLTRYKDPELLQEAIVGGDAWQEVYIQVTPGEKPRITFTNQNPHAIYPDPNSRDLVSRDDCEFIDRVSWVTLGELMERFPEVEDDLVDELAGFEEQTTSNYDQYKKYADRDHETKNIRNGKFKVIERFYKVKRSKWIGRHLETQDVVELGHDEDGTKREYFKKEFPGYTLHSKREEFLYVAIVCPSLKTMEKYLYNGEYHCQPRDPLSRKIIFPFVQLFSEQLDGETNGFVEYMVGPSKIINSMMSNKLHSAKHAVNTSLIGDPSYFDDDQRADIEKNHSDGDRTFWTQPGKDPTRALSLLPQGNTNNDTEDAMTYADAFQEQVSAAPPAARGISEGNVPGVLNNQRIEQAFVMLLTSVENYKLFLTKRAKLIGYYDREYSTDEEVFRVIEKKSKEGPEWMSINKPEMDEYGNIQKANDISTAEFDIVFEDSWNSPTVREKTRQQIIQLQQNAAVQQDPVLNTFLTLYFLKLSDAPQDLKDYVESHSTIVEQYEARKAQMTQQAGQLENISRLQNVATNEANAIGGIPEGLPQEGAAVPAPAGPQPNAQVAVPEMGGEY